MENSLAEYLGIRELTPSEERVIKAVSAIVNQDQYLSRMGEAEQNLYGARETRERASLVTKAAIAVIEADSLRLESLIRNYLSKTAKVIDASLAMPKGFELNAFGIQNEVKAAIRKHEGAEESSDTTIAAAVV